MALRESRPSVAPHVCQRAGLFVVLLLSVPALHGCFGEASATYRGIVRESGSVPSHRFGADTGEGAPVRGAHVALAAGASPPPCATLLEDRVVAAERLPPNRARTGADGTFHVTMTFGGFPGVMRMARLCVAHPGHDSYEYRAIFGAGSGPIHGEEPITIRLRPTSAPPTRGALDGSVTPPARAARPE